MSPKAYIACSRHGKPKLSRKNASYKKNIKIGRLWPVLGFLLRCYTWECSQCGEWHQLQGQLLCVWMMLPQNWLEPIELLTAQGTISVVGWVRWINEKEKGNANLKLGFFLVIQELDKARENNILKDIINQRDLILTYIGWKLVSHQTKFLIKCNTNMNWYHQVLTEYLSEKLSPIVSQGTENIDVVTSRE